MESDSDDLSKIIDFFESNLLNIINTLIFKFFLDHKSEFLISKQTEDKNILKQILLDKIDDHETGDLISNFLDNKNDQLDLTNTECIVQVKVFGRFQKKLINTFRKLVLFWIRVAKNLFQIVPQKQKLTLLKILICFYQN